MTNEYLEKMGFVLDNEKNIVRLMVALALMIGTMEGILQEIQDETELDHMERLREVVAVAKRALEMAK